MKAPFDRWLDTRDKRHMAYGCVTLCLVLILLLPYVLLGLRLLKIQTYEDVFALLKEPILSHTYVSRFVLLCLERAGMDVMSFLYVVMRSFVWQELAVFGLWLWLCRDRKMRIVWRVFALTILTGIVAMLYCGVKAYYAQTLMDAMIMMKYIAVILLFMAGIGIVLHLFMLLFIYGFGYLRAMRYTVEEYREEELYRLMNDTNSSDDQR